MRQNARRVNGGGRAAQLVLSTMTIVAVLAPVSPAAAADEARALAYGRHLSQQCTTCHRVDGANTGIPSIIGWEKDQFLAVLDAYRTNVRTNEVMVSLAQSLGDAEMQALAAYFGSLKPVQAKPPAKKR